MENNNNLKKLNEQNNSLTALFLLILPLFFIVFFILIPILKTLIMSFQQLDMYTMTKRIKPFIFFKSYIEAFKSRFFINSFLKTFFYTFNIVRLIIMTGIPLLLAYLLSKLKKGTRIFIMILISLSVLGLSSMFIGNALRFVSWKIWTILNTQYSPFKSQPFFISLSDIIYNIGISSITCIVLYLGIIKWSMEKNEKIWKKIGIGTLIIIILSLGFSLQLFNPFYLITDGDTGHGNSNLIVLMLQVAFKYMKFGSGTVITLLLIIPSICLGILLGLIIHLTGMKIYISGRKNQIMQNEEYSFQLITVLLTFIIVSFLLFIFFMPHLIFFLTSFRTVMDIHSTDSMLPKTFTLINYFNINKNLPIFKYLTNTIIFSVLPIIFQLGISLAAGFALGRYRFGGRKIIFFIISSLIFITPSLLSITSYLDSLSLGRIIRFNHMFYYFIMILPNPLTIILFTLFFEGIRYDIAELKEENSFPVKKTIKNKILLNTILMSIFVSCILFIFNIENMIPKFVFSSSADTIPLMIGLINILKINGDYGGQAAATIATLLPFFFNLFILIIILQIFFFPKLRIIFDRDQFMNEYK